MLTIIGVPLALLFAFVLYFAYKCFVHPLLDILYYKKQGGTHLFHWELLSYFKNFRNARQRSDFYYVYKEAYRKNPDARFIVENFGPKTLLVLLDPAMIKELLQKYEIYQKDTEAVQLFLELANGSTPFNEGADWKKGRRILSTAFNYEFTKEMIPLVVETAQEGIKSWVANGELKDVHIFEKVANIIGESTGKIFFGKRFNDHKIRGEAMSTIAIQLAYDLFNEAFALTSIIFGSKFPKTNIFPRHRRINSDITSVRETCKMMIAETVKSGKKEKNLLTHLLDLRKTDAQDNGLTDEQITGEFVGLFGAGTDTTSNLVTCAIYFLTQRPDIFKKVKEEVDRELADMKTITIENLNRMDYTTAFFKEVLRLNVGCLFYRKAMENDNLAGVEIKKGTILTVLINVNHTDEKYYSNPEEVIPERWISGTTQNQDGFKKEPFSYIPFSAGPRTCIGQHFAMVEAKVLLGLIMKTFDFEIPENYKFQLVQGVVFEPLDPLKVSFQLKK